MRHLSGHQHLHALGRVAARPDFHPVLHPRLGAERRPLPGCGPPVSTPALRRPRLNSTAGAHTPFSIELTRPDGDQNLSALTVATPPGFSATLAGIPYCPDAALTTAAEPSYTGLAEEANPSCPAASQIGTAVTGAGAGTHPVYFPGKVYLAGPYKGAPLSLSVITPAVSGPYDLGNVVVRAALHVNPTTAQITAVSDPLPSDPAGHSAAIALDPDRSQPARLHAQPDQLRPLLGRRDDQRRPGCPADPPPTSRSPTAASLPFAPKLDLKALRRHQARWQPRPPTDRHHPSPAQANIA